MIAYLEVEEVMAIHEQMIDLFGGEYGVRGEQGRGLVESAVARPRNKAAYEGAALVTQARPSSSGWPRTMDSSTATSGSPWRPRTRSS